MLLASCGKFVVGIVWILNKMGREGNSSAPGWVTSEEAAFNTIVKRCVPEKKEKKNAGTFRGHTGSRRVMLHVYTGQLSIADHKPSKHICCNS